jgi:type IV pilus assembly protein PilA
MCFNAPMNRHSGFTWIEMMAVIAVIAILAVIAVPSLSESAMKKQVKDALALADVAKTGVQVAYTLTGDMPADNKAAGVPDPDKIVGTLVKEVRIDQGAVTITLGNNAHSNLVDKHVTLLPAIVPGEPRVPIAWLCHNVNVPNGMQVRGQDRTDVPYGWLPVECRGPPPAK